MHINISESAACLFVCMHVQCQKPLHEFYFTKAVYIMSEGQMYNEQH